jgi:hypothetical protein
MHKSKEINDKNTKIEIDENNPDLGNYLNYLKINGQNKLEEIDNDAYIQQCIIFSSTLAQENENIIGVEINKFFNLILAENKEGEPLKVNIAISNRNAKEKNINKQINEILNNKFTEELVLNDELSENLAIILTTIYQKIHNKYKFSSFNELVEQINNYNLFERDILKEYLITDEENRKKERLNNSPVKPDYVINRFITNSPNKIRKTQPNLTTSKLQIKSPNRKKEKERIMYEFKPTKSDNDLPFPIEMLILKRKFHTIKKLKLIVSNSRSKKEKNIFDSDSFSDKDNSFFNLSFSSNLSEKNLKPKDVQNNIYVLLNLNWLFPHLIEIEIDLSNDNIVKDQISVYNSGLKYFSKLLRRNLKNTDYSQNKIKKINYDPLHGSIFDNYFQLEEEEEEISNNSSESLSLKVNTVNEEENMFGSNLENNYSNKKIYNYLEENQLNNFDSLINKYQYTFQMIILYAFFISKIPQLLFCNFTIPFNFENEILRMLQLHQIYLSDFNLLSFLSEAKMIRITIDFNCLDNKAFQEVLSLLFKNNDLRVCQLNFFPSENYFIPELLLKLLQDCNSNYKISSINKYDKIKFGTIEPHEDVDIFLFKKLSEYFEININKLFQAISIKSTVNELSLIFNIPSLLKKIDFYLMVILKFILNIIIAIDNMKLNLSTFNLQTSNFFFDNNKYPFLEDFLDNIYIFLNNEIKISKLTCQMRFINIKNLYRIIPYHVTQLSLGELDLKTFIFLTKYLTSSNFSVHSKLGKLKINLSNTLLNIDECYEYLIKLLDEYPKGLKEIGINTHLKIKKEQIDFLLKKIDYNTIENIFLNFDKMSLEDAGFKTIKKDIYFINNDNIIKNDNYMKLFFVKRTHKSTTYIMSNIMYNLSLKYNKNFMDYNIFRTIEKFRCTKEEKEYIIRFT